MEPDPSTTQTLTRPEAPPRPGEKTRDWIVIARRIRGVVGLVAVVVVISLILMWGGSLLQTKLVELGVPTRPPSLGDEAAVVTAPTTPPVTAAPGLPEGLTCQQLADNGLGYAQVVAYWLRSGSSESLGGDRPCTDVYDEGEIDAFLSQGEGQSSKAGCQVLSDEGLDYTAAVAYFLRKDRPKRLDPDGDGLPCTDVYPQAGVDAFLHFDRQPTR